MTYQYIKALHIIFVVTWFAGLFYIPRLFIYQTEAYNRESPAKDVLISQFKLMSKRLWFGITWPSAILTLLFGLYFLHTYAAGAGIPRWLWIKLGFVAGLYVYHGICHVMYKNLQHDQVKYTSTQLRIWNEVATLFLVSIVFLVILKNTLSMLWGIAGLVLFTLVLLLAIRLYKRIRESKQETSTEQVSN